MKILITSGGTKVKIDSVRHISNMSTGTFGSKIATESLKVGHEILFLKAKGSKSPLTPTFKDGISTDDVTKQFQYCLAARKLYEHNYSEFLYSEFAEYATQLEHLIKTYEPDVIVLAAAVSDYGVEDPVEGKIRTKNNLFINLTPLPKLISSVRNWAPKAIIIGFKLLVNSSDKELLDAAKESLIKNHLDAVVANDLRDIKNDNHRLIIVTNQGIETYQQDEEMNPNYLAKRVINTIERIKNEA